MTRPQIKAAVKRLIRQGEISTSWLVQRFGEVVIDVIDDLEASGKIIRVRGQGAFICEA